MGLLYDWLQDMKTQVDWNDPGHEKLLIRLWKSFNNSSEFPGRKSESWKEIGFQGFYSTLLYSTLSLSLSLSLSVWRCICCVLCGGMIFNFDGFVFFTFSGDDPQTDFRGMGLLGLKSLVYMGESYNQELHRIFKYQPTEINHQYPFSVALIHCASMVCDQLQIRELMSSKTKYEDNKLWLEQPLFRVFTRNNFRPRAAYNSRSSSSLTLTASSISRQITNESDPAKDDISLSSPTSNINANSQLLFAETKLTPSPSSPSSPSPNSPSSPTSTTNNVNDAPKSNRASNEGDTTTCQRSPSPLSANSTSTEDEKYAFEHQFYDVVCMLACVLDKMWHTRHATYFEFPQVLEALKQHLSACLALDPPNLDALIERLVFFPM